MQEFPPFRLDSANQCLWQGSERVRLTPKAFAVLQYLIDRGGRLVSQKELLDDLWKGVFVQPEVLKTHIRDIRAALGDDAKSPSFIETVPRRGYRFIARTTGAPRSQPPGRAESAASIAVLPFTNLGPKDNGYFSDGLSEEIIDRLARNPGLRVIARTSAFAFKDRHQDIRQIAEALGVANILEGSVRAAGSRVRINAHLIRASDGSHFWSGRYDREVTDIFAIQDEISEAIAGALPTTLQAGARRSEVERAPADPRAYQAYLEGRHQMHQVTPSAIDRALECFERAIALDPAYALPHAGLALRAYYQVIYLGVRPRQIVPAAMDSLAQALRLDPECCEAHLARGLFAALYDYDWQAADAHFARALELDPFSARARTARALWLLCATGRLEEALAEITYAVGLDPLSPPVRNTELWVLHSLRRAEAAERARELLQLFPSHLMINFIASLAFLGQNLPEEAVATLESGLAIVPGHPHLLGLLAFALASQQRIADARRICARLEEQAAARCVPFGALARAYEACGEMDRAYEFLDRAIEDREPLVVHPLADRRNELGGDQRYQTLLRKMNLA